LAQGIQGPCFPRVGIEMDVFDSGARCNPGLGVHTFDAEGTSVVPDSVSLVVRWTFIELVANPVTVPCSRRRACSAPKSLNQRLPGAKLQDDPQSSEGGVQAGTEADSSCGGSPISSGVGGGDDSSTSAGSERCAVMDHDLESTGLLLAKSHWAMRQIAFRLGSEDRATPRTIGGCRQLEKSKNKLNPCHGKPHNPNFCKSPRSASALQQGQKQCTHEAPGGAAFQAQARELHTNWHRRQAAKDEGVLDGFVQRDDARTTVMLCNFPFDYTRDMLIQDLDQEGFAGAYDFVYLPFDFKTRKCLGYAFVNLVGPSEVQMFWKVFDGFAKWAVPHRKACRVTWSIPHQGRDVMVARFRNSPVMHSKVPDEFKPALYDDGQRKPFPPPTKSCRAPRERDLVRLLGERPRARTSALGQ